jgi:predicted transcriptional regulator of viral defense system
LYLLSLDQAVSSLTPLIMDIYRYMYRICDMKTQRQQVNKLLQKKPLLLSSELTADGIDRKTITRMVDAGELIRVYRGLYRAPDYTPHQNYSLIEAQMRVRNGVICLISALSYHDIGAQNPSKVWIAVPRKTWLPKSNDMPIQIVTFSPKAFDAGISELRIVEYTRKNIQHAKNDCRLF